MADVVDKSPDTLIQTHAAGNLRVTYLYVLVLSLLLTLATGFAYRQLIQTDLYNEREKIQNQRRILIPGPRGNIYDRDGNLLVANRPRVALILYLDQLRPEFRKAYLSIRRAYRDADDKNLPSASQLQLIARYSVVNKYLGLANTITGREDILAPADLNKHFRQNLLLPFILLDDLNPAEYARLLEQLPTNSPLQLYTSTFRAYPQGSIAAHALGYVSTNTDIEPSSDFPGSDLTTFKMKGTVGREGLESTFDETLSGQTGGAIFLVDPSGFRINPPLESRHPTQGRDIHTTIDSTLQAAAESALTRNGLNGAAVAVSVKTGEVLAIATAPDYNLTDIVPRFPAAIAKQISEKGAWLNRATMGLYPPGSSFKPLIAIAALNAGAVHPDDLVECNGYYMVSGRKFNCHDGHAHGPINLGTAIAKSCNVYFYKVGLATGIDKLAATARNFGFGTTTGIQIPEIASFIPDPAWKKSRRNNPAPWYPGDTVNFSIGQGDVLVTPLQMALFAASLARKQTTTKPTLIIPPGGNPPLNTSPIDITPENYAALLEGMEQCTLTGTGRILQSSLLKIRDLRIAGKTGTAQKATAKGTINFAWYICFAPIEDPQIAIATVLEGNVAGEETGGGRYAAPLAQSILKAWHEKQEAARPPPPPM